MSFGEKDGQEFGEVEVTLIAVVELHVPNKFVVRGHVVVSDHAVIPTGTELHSDVASDEVMGMVAGQMACLVCDFCMGIMRRETGV